MFALVCAQLRQDCSQHLERSSVLLVRKESLGEDAGLKGHEPWQCVFHGTEESSTRRMMSRISTFAPTLNVSLTRSLKPANRARDRDLTALSAKPHPSLSHFLPRGLDGTSATTWTRSVQTLPAPSLGCPGTGSKESKEGRSRGPCGSAVAPCRAPSESSQPAPSGPEGRAMTYDSTKPPHCLGVELLVGNRNLPKQGIGKPTPLHCLRPALPP